MCNILNKLEIEDGGGGEVPAADGVVGVVTSQTISFPPDDAPQGLRVRSQRPQLRELRQVYFLGFAPSLLLLGLGGGGTASSLRLGAIEYYKRSCPAAIPIPLHRSPAVRGRCA